MGVKSNAQKIRREVLNGKRHKTSGGLRREDLMVKNGRIVSKVASRIAKRNKNLGQHQDNPPFPPFHSALSKEFRGRRRRSKQQ